MIVMYKIKKHPILDIPEAEKCSFTYEEHIIQAQKGFTIAAALHQAGFPVHSKSVKNRNRSLECGIGKCGACEMLVDGKVKRICITKVDNVKEVTQIPKDFQPRAEPTETEPYKTYRTRVAIIGAGPAGLAAREVLNEHGVDNIVIDNNEKIGGQFLMQTHQFFFFEKEKQYGGMRGFDIAETLAGDDKSGIFLNSVVWDILEGKRIAVKNIKTEEIFFILTDQLIIATGAVPFLPGFENDDVPGVYTAAVVQKMMNTEFTLLGKNVLTIGAGNIGYLTSYQLMQAGANVRAIIEAMPHEGGFPVQANRVKRLAIPIMTGYTLLKAIPNKDNSGIIGAVIAKAENFKPVPGTEKEIYGIDAINVCTGLIPDDQLKEKGEEIFGRDIQTAGDALRIGEGTSAVLRGKQVAYETLNNLKIRYEYNHFLQTSKEYFDSQQEPVRVLDEPYKPSKERAWDRPFVLIDCLHGFACNPCAFACPFGAITKSSTSTAPQIDYDKCTGCMKCVNLCPGLAIFGYNLKKDWLFLPIEYEAEAGKDVFIVNNQGEKIGEGIIEKILEKPNKTNVARVKTIDMHGEDLMNARGFIVKNNYPEPLNLTTGKDKSYAETFVCHCEDVKLKDILDVIGDRKFISVDEVKHNTRLGMGPCRGSRCIKRLRQMIGPYGVEITGESTPRAPMSNQLVMAEMYPREEAEKIIPVRKEGKPKKVKVKCLIAGGGMAGSGLFRYMAEAGLEPVLINKGRGSSWRNIAGGRPAFSLPALADIAINNKKIFEELQKTANIDYRDINYVSFAHDDATYRSLDASRDWSDAIMIEPKDFSRYISPHFNPNLKKYKSALVTNDCWQATPGKTLDIIRSLGVKAGGTIQEDCNLIDLHKQGSNIIALVQLHDGTYMEYETEHFVNALGDEAEKYAEKLGIYTGVYPVRHQAFITRRLPFMGVENKPLPMMIDRQNYKGFSAVYGQQLGETGQLIGCASPAVDPQESDKNLKINSKAFMNIVSEVFIDWIPELSSAGFQAVWGGYYVEPRYIVDPGKGLFIGLRGHGFMLSQYLAKLYVDKLTGKTVPDYFDKLRIENEGLSEAAFK
jgi:glycine/D-amino acid oxidase-like deaminating enzyme/NADPH-dependent 2,4-dienoyl-CoA reductase/sulfur reductase-like enzyme/Fe-S-cluster-containing hydrogenase component 2